MRPGGHDKAIGNIHSAPELETGQEQSFRFGQMRTRNMGRTQIVIACLVLASVAPTYSQTFLHEILRDSLAGATSLSVITQIDTNADGDRMFRSGIGMNTDRLKTRAELHLRKSGLPILELEKPRPDGARSGEPVLVLEVQAICNQIVDVCAVSILANVTQPGKLWRDERPASEAFIYSGSTWRYTKLLLAGSERIRDSFDSNLADVLDTLANDWLTVNPKRQ